MIFDLIDNSELIFAHPIEHLAVATHRETGEHAVHIQYLNATTQNKIKHVQLYARDKAQLRSTGHMGHHGIF